ncbi:MAG: hypothetical protein ACXVPN_00095 [Bacteroidia bacterium]
MKSGRFYVAWLIASGLMYLMFYAFHGIITNDLLKVSIPKTAFLSIAAVVYLILGLALNVLLDAAFFKKEAKNIFTRALIAGPIVAIFMYATAIVTGISFSAKFSMVNLMVDVGWQVCEQTVGCLVIAIIKIVTFTPDEIEV